MRAEVLTLEINETEIPIIFEQDNRLPLVTMQLVFRHSGSLSDLKAGVAKLSSELLGEGTKEQGSIAFATALENRAVSLSASVGAETFVITLSSLKSEFDFAISSLSNLLKDPNYSSEAFGKVKAQMIGLLTQKQSDFDYTASNQLKSILFANTPKSNPTRGTVESVNGIVLDDIKEHIESHLGYDNLIAVVGGNVGEDDAKDIVKKIATVLPRVDVRKLSYFHTISQANERATYAKTEQAYVYFGAPYDMPYNSDEVYMGRVASFVLGSSGFGSRLMEEIRVKRGLAYSAYSSFNVSRTSSYFSGYLQTKLESMDEAKKVVAEVLSQFIDKGITQSELDAAKQFLLGSEPLRNETLQQRVARAFSEYYDGRKLGYKIQELAQIDTITLKQINDFIKAHSEIGDISFSIVTAESTSR